jgi:CheY-like chemotaxis protein
VTPPRDGPASSAGRILVVEDSPSAQRLVQEILLRLGAQLPDLRIAGTVVEALTIFSQWRPDLVFVDIELRAEPVAAATRDTPTPGRPEPRDGIELARLIRSRNPSVAIVVSSAADPSDPRVAALRTEPRVEFLTKPLLASRVAETLTRLAVVPQRRGI